MKPVKIISDISQYRMQSTVRSLYEIAKDWALIFLILAIVFYYPHWWSIGIAIPVIGAIQYNLLVLLHDAQHGLLSRQRRLNDLLATWLLAAPFGVVFSKSRLVHMRHHQHLGLSEADPDYPLYCTKDPAPKDTFQQFILHFLRQVLWAKLTRVFLAAPNKNNEVAVKPVSNNTSEAVAVLVCQAVIFLLFLLTGYWHAYFYLWLLPLITVATFLNDMRIFCEHSNPQDEAHASKGLLISYISNPVERFFFGPHHMNYHAEHHFFPYVPHYHLPKIRKTLIDLPEYQEQIQWRRGYFAHIKNYIHSIVLSRMHYAREHRS